MNAPLSRTFSSVIKCLCPGRSGASAWGLIWGPKSFTKEAVRNQRAQNTSGKAGSLVPLLINQDPAATLLNASRWSWRQSVRGNCLIASQSGSSLLDTVLVPVRSVLRPSIRTMTLPPTAALWAHYLGICCTQTVTHEEPAAKSPNAIIFWFHKCSSIIAFVFLLYLAWNRHSH